MTQVAADQRCAVRSELAAEPLAGTAGHVLAGYLLLEEPGSWAHQPFGGRSLGGLGGQIDTAASQAGVKALLIRAGGRRDRAPNARRIYAATIGHRRQLVTFTVTNPADLLSLDLAAYAGDLRGIHPAAVEVTEPLLLVCTHAKRDQCCAIRGLPIAKALAGQQRVGRVFECSHLGGHRFAATALSLPSGAVYGRLTQAAAERVHELARDDRVHAADLRGMSHLPQPAQVVDAELRRRLDLPNVDEVRLVECAKVASHTHLVRMTAAAQTWSATLRTATTGPKPPSCGKPDAASTEHVIVSLRAES